MLTIKTAIEFSNYTTEGPCVGTNKTESAGGSAMYETVRGVAQDIVVS